MNSKTPLFGTAGVITSYIAVDAVGRVRLCTGVEVPFGQTACKWFVPAVGQNVVVTAVAPYRLGGFRATSVQLRAGV